LITWGLIETALSAWIVSTSKIKPDHLQWANTRTFEPTRPFVRLKRSGLRGQYGIGGELQVIDRTTDEVSPDPGQEIEYRVAARGTFTLSVQVFSTPVVGTAQATVSAASERTALDYLTDIKDGLALPSIVDILSGANVAFVEASEIRDVPESKDNAWSSRAQMDVTFNATNVMSERGTFIEEVVGQFEDADHSIEPIPFDFKAT
jgi:hypothetical protein